MIKKLISYNGAIVSNNNTLVSRIIDSGGGADTPPITTNLLVYFDPERDVFSDAGTTLAVDGDNIRQINDQSGNNNTLNQSTASFQPVYKTTVFSGGKASIESIGDEMLLTSTLNLNNSTSWTWYLVYQKASNSNTFNWFEGVSSSFPRPEFLTTSINIRSDAGSPRTVTYTDNTNIKVLTISVDRVADSYDMYINGSYIGSSGSQVTSWPLTIGKIYANDTFGINSGRALFFTDAHDSIQITQMSNWLKNFYSIP